MSEHYQPSDGETVEVVLRGKVSYVAVDERHFLISAGGGWRSAIVRDDPCVVSITKVPDPIPTAMGTVLRLPNGVVLERWSRDWRVVGDAIRYSDAEVADLARRAGGFTVLYLHPSDADGES